MNDDIPASWVKLKCVLRERVAQDAGLKVTRDETFVLAIECGRSILEVDHTGGKSLRYVMKFRPNRDADLDVRRRLSLDEQADPAAVAAEIVDLFLRHARPPAD